MPSSGVQTCARSEEHTSELQSHDNLVCRLLLEKKTPQPRSLPEHAARMGKPERVGRAQRAAPAHTSATGDPDGGSRPHRQPHDSFFFFNDTAPPEIYPLSLHAALPI